MDSIKDITIRKTTKADIKLIQQVADAAYLLAYRGKHTEAQNIYTKDLMYSTESLIEQYDNGSEFYLAETSSGPCGYIAIYKITDNEELPHYHLDKLYILPELKGQGLGKILINHAVEILKEREQRDFMIDLMVNRNNDAIDFYKHLGFSIIDSVDKPIGRGYIMNAYIMKKTIDYK